MWNERFNTDDYVFGKSPSRFLTEHSAYLAQGQTALSVGDGEGRNSVFMAEHGIHVTALEFAPNAIDKARKLASERGVTVDFRHCDVLSQDWPEGFDLVAGIFIQFTGPDGRRVIFDKMKATTKPGGLVMLHGFTPEQVDLGTGGLPSRDNMYTESILHDAFAGWQVLDCRAYRAEQGSGSGHVGEAALIDFIARKPA